ncbi:SubName: Full=Uncharacterized protein {ECO:0000313/EMBL:CCA72545.1} [Serendipita indica DSM 11827]|uniref:C2H2-type domain-containing protein n=1 Tax=Serendipita indica (strain DSM 11827) TaxID=1109443 RepID=G4TMK2_SERID|nr:SubName: Full=Uncharacterized protein {ECO:0000313/EMBL:CCA72545.1} [Serendipita indica DSM 11827]CCA72545.1 hypothetical protein PIIN_06482 [Serendipita indica DSM 11827]
MSSKYPYDVDEASSDEEDTGTVGINLAALAPGNPFLQDILHRLVVKFQRSQTPLVFEEVEVCFNPMSSTTRECALHKKDGSGPCLKKYGRLDRSIYHIQSHLGIKPYECTGCPNPPCTAKFSSLNQRETHKNDAENYVRRRTLLVTEPPTAVNLERILDLAL